MITLLEHNWDQIWFRSLSNKVIVRWKVCWQKSIERNTDLELRKIVMTLKSKRYVIPPDFTVDIDLPKTYLLQQSVTVSLGSCQAISPGIPVYSLSGDCAAENL